MFKKIIFLLLLSVVSFSATKKDINNPDDWVQGWLWYNDANTTQTQKPVIMFKKDKEVIKLLQDISDQNKKNLEVQNKLLKVLQKAYDPQPETIIGDDGKPCIANSSDKCFKMPVVPEAQGIPVLRDWLLDPTNPEKNKAFLRWQAKFLDLKFKGGYALNLAAKQGGPDAYPIGAVTKEFGTASGDYLRHRRTQMKDLLETKKNNMEIYILLGQTAGFEIQYPHKIFDTYNMFEDMGIKTKIILKDSEYKAFFETLLSMSHNPTHKSSWEKIKQQNGVVISPKTFESVNPYATPYVVLKYKDSNKSFSQVIAVGKDGKEQAFQGLYRTLIINDVIQSKQMHASGSSKAIADEVIEKINEKREQK